MIKIEIWNDHIKIEGHANAANKGNDIYCAGVSAIIMGAINWFKPQEINFQIEDGFLDLKLIDSTNKKNLEKISLLAIQLLALDSKENSKYLKFIDHCKGE